jgi:Co/Zn/Cd efflux system component
MFIYDHQNDNISAAYLHVLADVLTRLTVIIALTIGLFFSFILGWVP